MRNLIATIVIAILAISGLQAQPSGSIIAFGGPKDKIPAGWVKCDGQLYDRTNITYRKLFNAIGTSWGGDGANKFAVPDLRGLFIRGVAESKGTDPDKDQRTQSRPDLTSQGNSGNEVGSKQPDAFKKHSHGYRDRQEGAGNQADSGDDVGFDKVTAPQTGEVGGSETRPQNAYVYYIIKL